MSHYRIEIGRVGCLTRVFKDGEEVKDLVSVSVLASAAAHATQIVLTAMAESVVVEGDLAEQRAPDTVLVPLDEAGRVPTAQAPIQFDNPSCSDCGSITQRTGTCYTCIQCGSTTGCG